MTVNDNHDRLSRPAAWIAGLGLLAMAVLVGYANFTVLDRLIDTRDAARTARQIHQSLPLFHQGVQAFYAVAGLDVVVAWALYGLFRKAGPNMALLSAVLRSLYGGGLAWATWQLQQAEALYSQTPGSTVAFALVRTFYTMWESNLILFGFHLLAVGWLAFVDKRLSGAVAAILGTLLIITGLGYVVDSIAFLAYPGPRFTVTSYTFAGEVVFMLWLLWTGVTGGRRKAR